MKKKGFILSVFFAFCAFALTLNVSAISGSIFGATDATLNTTTENGKTISITNKGANSEVYIGVNATTAIPNGTTLVATVKMGNSSYSYTKCGKVGSSWNINCTKGANDTVIMTLKSIVDIPAGDRSSAGKVILDGSTASTDPCTISIAMNDVTESPKCQIKDDKYYCANGTECTENEYKSQCETTENPQTGSFLPYAVIAGGLVVAIGLYMMTKKNKIYHI